MGPLTFDDVLRWDLSAVYKVFLVGIKHADTLSTLEVSLQHIHVLMREEWVGEAGQAFDDEMRKMRQDIDADRRESLHVADAVGRAEEDVIRCQAEAQRIQAAADANHWTITPDWQIDVAASGDTAVRPSLLELVVSDAILQLLQDELDKLHTQAHQTDQKLATAMRAADGEFQLGDTGHPPPAQHQRPAPHINMPTGPVDPNAIRLSQVSYSRSGKWGSGQKAVRGYINQALDAMGITNPTARANWMTGMLTLVERESGLNAKSGQVNNWDSNAQASTRTLADGYGNMDSRGAAQCIPSTFAANHQPGTSNSIYNPAANIAADMNHLMSAYGVSRNGSNLAALVPQANPNAAPAGQ
jgi:hypothetical protein